MENLMKTQKILFVLSIAVILLVASACGPAQTTPDAAVTPTQDTSILTAIAQTAQAGVSGTLTQLAAALPSQTTAPLFTATASQTALPIASPTSTFAMISVSVETLCRLGPNTVYDRVSALGVNTPVQVYGVDPTHGYYFIQNPSQPGSYCWVWGFYATEINSFTGIPIYTPAYTPTAAITLTPSLTPTKTGTTTPTPGFTITNPRIRTCGADNFLDVTITNTGTTIFMSGNLYITDASGPAITGATNDNFIDTPDCQSTPHFTQGDLAAGEIGTVSTDPITVGDLSGHNLTINVTMCSADGLGGLCTVKSITFKP
jgi:hypothetical protein